MVAEAIDITRETYFCILMDRESNGPVLVASPDGGVDIEEVAEKTPERIKKIPVDIHTGVTDAVANELAAFLGFEGELGKQCAEQVEYHAHEVKTFQYKVVDPHKEISE
jgi:succinyl-CoA synthetase beta subunit